MSARSDHFSPASWRFCTAALAVIFLIQLGLYRNSFDIAPANDDFGPPLADVLRGETEGPGSFFAESQQAKNYRPLQSLLMWRFVGIDPDHALAWIRVLHFAGMLAYGLAALGWIRMLGLGRSGAAAALAILMLHPIVAGPLGSIDGFGILLSSAFMWLGTLAVIALRDKLPLAIGIAAVCMAAGSLVREHAFGIVPLSALAALWFAPRQRIARCLVTGAILLGLMLLSLYVRRYLMPEGVEAESVRGMIGLTSLPRNVLQYVAALLFTGDTIWVYLRRDAMAFAWLGVLGLGFGGLLLAGLWLRIRSRAAAAPATPRRHALRDEHPLRWITFLVLACGAGTFPAILTAHVSEVYVISVVLPLAMLGGIAADGYARSSRTATTVAGAMALAHLAVAAFAIDAKVEGLRKSGRDAAHVLDRILAVLPPEASDAHIALVFVESQVGAQPKYSVYCLPDDLLVEQANSLDWVAPTRSLRIQSLRVADEAQVDQSAFDFVLMWDAGSKSFRRAK